MSSQLSDHHLKPAGVRQLLFELQQDWSYSETHEGYIESMKAHTPYGIDVRFVKEFPSGHGV